MRLSGRSALISLMIVAVTALGAATASAALPEFLGTFPNAFSTSGGAVEFQGHGLPTVKCTSSGRSAGNEVVNSKEGKWDELFLGCTAVGGGITVKCLGVKDTQGTGSILATGTFTLGYELGTTNPVSALTLSPEVEFKCATVITAKVKGCFAGKDTPKNVGTTKALIQGTGTPLEDYTNDKKEAVKCELLGSSGGAFTLAVQIVKTSLSFASSLEIMA